MKCPQPKLLIWFLSHSSIKENLYQILQSMALNPSKVMVMKYEIFYQTIRGCAELWGFLRWAPLAKRKDHHGVSSGWSRIWLNTNTGLSVNNMSRWSLRLYSLSGKTSYRKISWSLEAARFGFKLFQSLWNLAGTSAALLPRCLSNFRAIRPLHHPISRLRDFMRFGGKTPYRLVNRGPGQDWQRRITVGGQPGYMCLATNQLLISPKSGIWL